MIRVLIANHQPIVSYGIRMLFESSSDIKIVNTINTKKQLMDYLKKGSIDVVLLSLDFADSNGITVLRNIKKEFNSIRVLIFSYQPENIYAASCIRAGASGYLLAASPRCFCRLRLRCSRSCCLRLRCSRRLRLRCGRAHARGGRSRGATASSTS